MGGRVLLVQLVIPDYRVPLLDLLASHLGESFMVAAGESTFDESWSTPSVTRRYMTAAQTRFFWRRRVAWQRGVVRRGVSADVAIVELNPRIISVWFMLVARRLLHRPTVAWGHAWPRRGPAASSDGVRNLMRMLASTVVCYTETDREALRRRMPRKRVLSAPNALYHERAIVARTRPPLTDFMFVGRLIPAKKPGLLVEAYAEAIALGLPDVYRLTFAGAGPELPELVAFVAGQTSIQDRVRFLGHVAPKEMPSLYASTLASVSPGYVGLSITQSISVGVPMIIARTEPHSPEIEAAVEGANAVFVPSNDSSALARALLQVARDRDTWIAQRPAIAAACATSYSLEKMASGIVEAVSPGSGPAAFAALRGQGRAASD